MKQKNYQKGKTGEDIAASYLQGIGFKIIEKNFSTRFGEIDLITVKNNCLVFVEVKLRVGEEFGTPEELINKRKISQVRRMAEMFLLKNKKMANTYQSQRIDAVAIVVSQNYEVERINHYENIGI